jgi:tRNA (mo5U34)-methyltransferase
LDWRLEVESPEERKRICSDVAGLEPWYQSFKLADWLEISGDHDSEVVLAGLDRLGFPTDFSGQRVLDVGCNAGHYSMVAKARGAREVIGVEFDPRFVRQARYVSHLLGLDIKFIPDDVHNVGPEFGTFDSIICTGLIYHMPDPARVFAKLSAVCTGTIYVETEFLLEPELTAMARFIEGAYKDDLNNWWIHGPECLEGMVRASGFRTADFRGFFLEPRGEFSPEGIPRGGRGLLIGKK